jgi:HD-GYP domain-containing protein (c-di-GMP phosphodiesterase class II)
MIDTTNAGRKAPDCIVYHGPATNPHQFGTTWVSAGDAGDHTEPTVAARPSRTARRKRRRWRPADELFVKGGATKQSAVLIVDASMLDDRTDDLGQLPCHVIIVAADEQSEKALGPRTHISLVGLRDAAARTRALRAACELSTARRRAVRRRRELVRMRRELVELNRIGMALMLERDQAVLLRRILDQGKLLTESDGAGLLLLETDSRTNAQQLRVELSEIDSLPESPALTAATIPVDDTSIVGHAALTGKPIVIDDAYELPPDAGFVQNVEFDRQLGYRRRSMLIVPMVDHRDHVAGVLVFINRKSDPSVKITSKTAADRYVLRYTAREVALARSLASQAAVSIENARLYAQIEHIFQSFVKAAVTAIDQRDPTTAGHSVRVAALTTALADAVQRQGRGAYRDVKFTREQMRELYFAALLHDFGKIAVREDVLTKAKKLPPALWERVDARFDLISRTLEVEYLRKRASLLSSDANARQAADRFEAEFVEQRHQLARMHDAVRAANEPAILPEVPAAELVEIAKHSFEAPDGSVTPYLTPDELHYLQLPKGSLDARERAQVQSHVAETHRYLIEIPWTENLINLPEYSYEHHEKLDGSGYPMKLRGEEIPIQARMMTIADIFDALTASDRPYKRAVAPEKALEIIQAEASAGKLDAELVRVMVEGRVYRRVLDEDWHRL